MALDIRELNVQDLRHQFGIVLQDPFLFTGTLESNVRLGTETIDRAAVQNALREVGLGPFLDSLPQGAGHARSASAVARFPSASGNWSVLLAR